MKKILSIALVLGFSFGLTACEKENAADYYGKLRQECQQKDSKSCCLSSVDKMESVRARQVSHDGECDYGYQKNLLRCPDTFTWCEKEDNEKFNVNPPKNIVCTEDAKQCPDGSFVGRTEPNCEFAKCPNKPNIIPENPAKIKGCTKEYHPVCGEIDTGIRCIQAPCPSTKQKTYSNKCMAENAGAKILYKGKCKDKSPAKIPEIPKNCKTWFDGCNNCGVKDGKLTFCTRMACRVNKTPKCVHFE